MPDLCEDFKEQIPPFTEFLSENYPAGAAHDSSAPWNAEQPEDWKISGVSYDEDNAEIVFQIESDGYPGEVRIWAGDNIVINEIDPSQSMNEDEFDAKLASLVSTMSQNTATIPEPMREYIESQLSDKYEKQEPPQDDTYQ